MNKLKNIRYLTRLALLVAVVLVMSYTPLGMVPIGPINASLLTIPVAVGAMTMGPLAGGILGAAFGAASFMNAVEGKSALGMNLLAASPVGYFVDEAEAAAFDEQFPPKQKLKLPGQLW